MSDVRDLIAKLEAAREGDREFDADIKEALGYCVLRAPGPSKRNPRRRGIAWRYFVDGYWQVLPHYTTALDAALSLVPEGAGVTLHSYWIVSRREAVWSAKLIWGFGGQSAASEDAPTAALALCIAALRARFPEEKPDAHQ